MQINSAQIFDLINKTENTSPSEIERILKKAAMLQGLNIKETAALLHVTDAQTLEKIFKTAAYVKDEIYGNRVVLFAPLYISNLCQNECLYCAFRCSNRDIKRRALTQEEIIKETQALLKQGHKRVLLVAGEDGSPAGLEYVYKAIDSVYAAEENGHKIKRVNVNIAPLVEGEFKNLAAHNIGTYQLFQETYHEPTYREQHIRGPKADYQFRLDAVERAMRAGISDVGIGPLLGLYDYKFEILALLKHIEHLEQTFGVGPHTISVPRIEPAEGSDISLAPPHKVSDIDFKKLVAVLRMAVPYTGIILSTRESATMRNELLHMGVSQISAGSKTNPGGYGEEEATAQFTLSDERSLAEVIESLVDGGFIPSFCTGCYRKGRVGKDFMDLAKPGLIKCHCTPNALLTFAEYLEDFAPESLRQKGYALIEKTIGILPTEEIKNFTKESLQKIKAGARDIYA